jgi:hypothetical protein
MYNELVETRKGFHMGNSSDFSWKGGERGRKPEEEDSKVHTIEI